MTALVLGVTVATRWFATRRGLRARACSPRARPPASLSFCRLLASVSENLGWRIAVVLICAALGLATLAMLALMRDRPSDVGLPPFGRGGSSRRCSAGRLALLQAWA